MSSRKNEDTHLKLARPEGLGFFTTYFWILHTEEIKNSAKLSNYYMV